MIPQIDLIQLPVVAPSGRGGQGVGLPVASIDLIQLPNDVQAMKLEGVAAQRSRPGARAGRSRHPRAALALTSSRGGGASEGAAALTYVTASRTDFSVESEESMELDDVDSILNIAITFYLVFWTIP